MANGNPLTETTGDKIRAKITEKFRKLHSEGGLQAAAGNIEAKSYQSLQQWAVGPMPPADVFLLACLRHRWSIEFEDVSLKDRPRVEFRFRQRQNGKRSEV